MPSPCQKSRKAKKDYIENSFFPEITNSRLNAYLANIDKQAQELKDYFREFGEYEPCCRFQGCSHVKEPDCGVKQALEEGKISLSRYENYTILYEELKNRKKY